MNYNYFLTRLFGILACFIASSVGLKVIIGGNKAGDDEFHYHASIKPLTHNHLKCGAGIIGEEFLITAAHCFYNAGHADFTRMFVLVGTNNLHMTSDPAITVDVEKYYLPREYIYRPGNPGDIAVIKLKQPLGLRRNRQLSMLHLPKHKRENYTGKTAIITGFGWSWIRLRDGKLLGGVNDSHLRYARVGMIDHCEEMNDDPKNAEKEICGQIKLEDLSKPRGACVGDSGGPLVYNRTIIGVLSITPRDCSEKEQSTIYTRVSHYLTFIHNAVNDKPSRNIRVYLPLL